MKIEEKIDRYLNENKKIYYHITPDFKIKSILKQGLILGSPETFGEIINRPDEKKYIHVGSNKKSLLKLAKTEHPEINWILLKINLNGYKLIKNEKRPRDNFFKINQSIPKEKILSYEKI